MILFGIMTMFYKYTEIPETNEEEIVLEGKNGSVNSSYKDDEKWKIQINLKDIWISSCFQLSVEWQNISS